MTISTEDVDEVIMAIENLVDDIDYRNNPGGTWSGHENMAEVRARLRRALINLITKAMPNEGLS